MRVPGLARRASGQQLLPSPDGETRPMRCRMLSVELLAACCGLLASAARAEDVIYGPDGAPTVVQRKLHAMSGRWEAGLSFDVALNTALVNQVGGLLSVSYH